MDLLRHPPGLGRLALQSHPQVARSELDVRRVQMQDDLAAARRPDDRRTVPGLTSQIVRNCAGQLAFIENHLSGLFRRHQIPASRSPRVPPSNRGSFLRLSIWSRQSFSTYCCVRTYRFRQMSDGWMSDEAVPG